MVGADLQPLECMTQPTLVLSKEPKHCADTVAPWAPSDIAHTNTHSVKPTASNDHKIHPSKATLTAEQTQNKQTNLPTTGNPRASDQQQARTPRRTSASSDHGSKHRCKTKHNEPTNNLSHQPGQDINTAALRVPSQILPDDCRPLAALLLIT
jgi:hypothetical protein